MLRQREQSVEVRTADEEGPSGPPSFIGRLVYGGILAFMAVDNLRSVDESVAYAESKDVPAADRLVPLSSVMLLLGSLGIILWRLPRLSTAAVVGFFAGVTPTMHDFWNVSDDQQRQQQMIHFLKNVTLLGAAVAFLGRARETRG